jgi:hypothetical protein
LSVRGTRNQYSKDNENKFHGVGSPGISNCCMVSFPLCANGK